jgi:hypothetical protein
MNQQNSSALPAEAPWQGKGGTAKKLSAYLWFNVEEGSTFTMAQVRKAIGIEEQTQSDRRLRELREQGWVIIGYKDDKSLPMNTYRLDQKGQRLWLGEKVERDTISNRLRREIFNRDHNTCVICGIYTGDEYPDLSGTTARMTIGHRIPNQRLGDATFENLQTECSRCNETIRNLLDDPEIVEDVLPHLDTLPIGDLNKLLDWLEIGRRTYSDIEIAYSRIRKLSPEEQIRAINFLRRATETDTTVHQST